MSSWPIILSQFWPSPCLIPLSSSSRSSQLWFCSFNTFSPIQCCVPASLFLRVAQFSQLFIYLLSLFFHALFPGCCTCSVITELQVEKQHFCVAGSSKFPAFSPVGVSIHCSCRVVLSYPSFAAQDLGGPQLCRVPINLLFLFLAAHLLLQPLHWQLPTTARAQLATSEAPGRGTRQALQPETWAVQHPSSGAPCVLKSLLSTGAVSAPRDEDCGMSPPSLCSLQCRFWAPFAPLLQQVLQLYLPAVLCELCSCSRLQTSPTNTAMSL